MKKRIVFPMTLSDTPEKQKDLFERFSPICLFFIPFNRMATDQEEKELNRFQTEVENVLKSGYGKKYHLTFENLKTGEKYGFSLKMHFDYNKKSDEDFFDEYSPFNLFLASPATVGDEENVDKSISGIENMLKNGYMNLFEVTFEEVE